jgi:hypothetical protein
MTKCSVCRVRLPVHNGVVADHSSGHNKVVNGIRHCDGSNEPPFNQGDPTFIELFPTLQAIVDDHRTIGQIYGLS